MSENSRIYDFSFIYIKKKKTRIKYIYLDTSAIYKFIYLFILKFMYLVI